MALLGSIHCFRTSHVLVIHLYRITDGICVSVTWQTDSVGASSRNSPTIPPTVLGTELGRQPPRVYLNGQTVRDFTFLSREAQKTVDPKNYNRIALTACRSFQSKHRDSGFRYPNIYASIFCQDTDGFMVRLVTRTVLRSKLGRTDADTDISQYYAKLNQQATWMLGPKKWVDYRENSAAKSPQASSPASAANVDDNTAPAPMKPNEPATASDILKTLSAADKRALLTQLILSL